MRCREQNAAYRLDLASQSQLAVELARRAVIERHQRELSGSDQNAKGDGQLEAATLLGDLGRGEIDDDAARRKLETAGEQGSLHAVATLAHHGSRQAHEV